MSNRKRTGIYRQLDRLGRIVLPKELRDMYQMGTETPIDIYINENEEIVVETVRAENACALCGSPEHTHLIGSELLCTNCIRVLQKQIEVKGLINCE